MKYAYHYQLQAGDRIIEPLFKTGLTKHHAIYLGNDANGIEWIAENHKLHGVRIVDASIYFQKIKKISRIEKFNGTDEQRRTIVKKALSLAGKPYNLINYNCEHFANEVITGRSESKQVLAALASFVLGLFFAVRLTNK